MLRAFMLLFLSVAFDDVQAALLVFSSTEYQVGAHGAAGTNTDEHLDSSPPHPLALSASAVATAGVDNHASASGFADDRVLAASAQSASGGIDTVGFGGGSFLGTFNAGPGMLGLHFQFDTSGTVFGAGNAQTDAKLTVTLVSNGETLYTQSFEAPNIFSTSFNVPDSSTGSLNVVLFSLASSNDASAFDSSSVHFQLSFQPLPEPSSLMVMLITIPLVLALRYGRSRLQENGSTSEGIARPDATVV